MTNIKNLYVNGKAPDQKLNLYNLAELDLSQELVRINKISANGIALTVAVILETPFTGLVSKNAETKGVTPLTVEAGEPLTFEVNVSAIDDRTKEPNKHCEAMLYGLQKTGCIAGQIVLMTFDGPAIPVKGLSPKKLDMNLEDSEDSVFNIVTEWENTEKEAALVAHLGNVAYVERQGYQKKAADEVLKEKIELLEKGLKDTADTALIPRIAALLECKCEFISETSRWKVEGTKWTGFVSDFLSR